MFLAPALYGVHAVLTGLSFVIMHALHVRLGFGFSAGLFDYVLNFKLAEPPAAAAAGRGAVFRALLRRLPLRHRQVRSEDARTGDSESSAANEVAVATAAGPAARARSYVTALGGAGNLESVTACTTRLRLIVGTQDTVDVQALKRLGARGVVKPSATALQVVVGPTADQLASEIREAMVSMAHESPVSPAASAAPPARQASDAVPSPSAPPPAKEVLRGLLAALGGRANVRAIEPASSRLRISVASTGAIDSAAIRKLGMRGVAIAAADCVHVIVGPAAEAAAVSLRELLAS